MNLGDRRDHLKDSSLCGTEESFERHSPPPELLLTLTSVTMYSYILGESDKAGKGSTDPMKPICGHTKMLNKYC